jgi:hypothetical protein
VALLPFVPEHIHAQGQVPPLNLTPPKVEAEKPAAPPPTEVSAQS